VRSSSRLSEMALASKAGMYTSRASSRSKSCVAGDVCSEPHAAQYFARGLMGDWQWRQEDMQGAEQSMCVGRDCRLRRWNLGLRMTG
jgi:hypothetical protein